MSSSKSIDSKFKVGSFFKYKDYLVGKVTGVKRMSNPLTGNKSIIIRYTCLKGGEAKLHWFFYKEGGMYGESQIITREQTFLELL